MSDVRKETRRVMEMAEDGIIDWSDLAEMCLAWMSEDDVVEMLRANDLIFDEKDYEEG